MDVAQVIGYVFQYGGTVIMAALFVWVFIQDKTKNSKLLEENTKMLDTLSKSNENIAKSLDLIQNNMITLDNKADRNYTEIVKSKKA
jgi:hypothetical protein